MCVLETYRMLFWSKRRTAPRLDSRSDPRAFSSRSLRSLAKSIRCSQSTAIVAPREAMFILSLPLSSLNEQLVVDEAMRAGVRHIRIGVRRWQTRIGRF